MKVIMLMLFLVVGLSAGGFKYDTISIKHTFYTSAFDTVKRYPIVVTWWETKASLSCIKRFSREDNFGLDPMYPTYTDLLLDYKGSGYDRGHNMPSFENECNFEGMNECFYFSNITPQTARLNRGDWKELEEYTRAKAMQYDSVKVWCGSIGSIKKIKRVSVPARCWKVIYIKKTKKFEAYIFENNDSAGSILLNHATTMANITKLTGLKFPIK